MSSFLLCLVALSKCITFPINLNCAICPFVMITIWYHATQSQHQTKSYFTGIYFFIKPVIYSFWLTDQSWRFGVFAQIVFLMWILFRWNAKGIGLKAIICNCMCCWVVYLHYPKCFQQFSNPEKSVILIKVTVRFICPPVNGVIPLYQRVYVHKMHASSLCLSTTIASTKEYTPTR